MLAWAGAAVAAPLDDKQHLGVASCATGVCHGKLTPQADSNVWLNEYRIWSTDDRHARAYQTLLSDESKRMAAKLGLPSAHTADICLDCHADNVPAEQRGPKFQLSDGVGCEACHGGAELWIESHTDPAATHQDNLSRGMLATENIDVRAEVCLSCHLGTRDQFATHRIMGAGHPRLSFELEAYSANQPAHYQVDDDYRARKGAPSGFEVWRAGQVQSVRRYLDLMASDLFAPAGGELADFAFFDCHSCHHPMDDVRWSELRRRQGLEPGGLRLQDQHLFMLAAVAGVLAPDERERLRELQVALLRGGQQSVARARAAAAALNEWLAARDWTTRAVGREQVAAVRRAIVEMGARGELTDFAAAEQAFLGIESLTFFLGDHERLQRALDALFEAVQSDRDYDPDAARQAMQRLGREL
ncbi:MAG TPA: multiheme c-type cytochrome [Pseudomonadales bacterium]